MTFDGAPTGHERNLLKASWDSKGEKIAAGSGDQSVAIWEARTGKLLNKLPGHRGAVNDVRFHPLGEPLCKSQNLSLPRLLFHSTSATRRFLAAYQAQKSQRVESGLHPRFNACDRYHTKHEADLATVVVSASSDRTLIVGELGR